MHNPGIFRNLAYVELEPYSEPWYIQNTVKNLRWKFLQKNSYLVHFYPQKFLMFPEMDISSPIFKEVTLLARKMENNLL